MAIVFIFGLIIGSFFNVVISRLPRGESIVAPASKCPNCDQPIKPYDNIPLISYLILKGRCRSCGQKISPVYPAVELLTATLFAASFYKFGLSLELAPSIFFLGVLIIVAFIDLREMIIPNKIIYPALLVSLIFTAASFIYPLKFPLIGLNSPLESLIGLFSGGLFLYFVALAGEKIFRQEAMGAGDIKLAAFMGLYLGRYIWIALFLGFFFGSLIGLFLIYFGGRGKRELIPFGPSLALGGALTLFLGPFIYGFYVSLAFG
ncbi:MAG: prepilin peptidase [Actinomycetota bacterium]|nr:prepilin peptidase [Actinomycetota bacterium]